MKYRVGILMGTLLCVVALPVRAQTVDIAAIMERMQEIISEMQALQAEFAELSTSLGAAPTTAATPAPAAPSGSVLGAATSVLQQEAVYGNDNDTIARIQTLLATDPLIYADGRVTGFFGPLTEEALKNLQARFGMDPVGVVGPETAQLLMEYFVAYPGGSYPTDVLKRRVTDPAVTAPAPSSATQTTAPKPSTTSNPIERIYLTRDDDETIVRVTLKAGGAFGLIANTRDEDELVEAIAKRGNLSEADVAAMIDMSEMGSARDPERDDDDDDYDKDDADDALDDARNAIRDARNAIRAAKDLGADEDTIEDAERRYDKARDELDDAERDFDDREYSDAYRQAREAIELAEEAEELADDAAEIDEDMAEDKIDEADDAIDDADDRIDAARADGDDVDDAEALLDDARDALDDAERDFDREDWEDAYEHAKRAIALAEDAEDAL